MTLYDGLKKTLHRSRSLLGRFGGRPYRVLFVKRSYTGGQTGDGARIEEWTPITHADGQPVAVRFIRIEERALAGLPDGAVEIGPLTPPFPGGGSNIQALLDSLNRGDTSHLRLEGGTFPLGALFRITSREQPSELRIMLRAVPAASE